MQRHSVLLADTDDDRIASTLIHGLLARALEDVMFASPVMAEKHATVFLECLSFWIAQPPQAMQGLRRQALREQVFGAKPAHTIGAEARFVEVLRDLTDPQSAPHRIEVNGALQRSPTPTYLPSSNEFSPDRTPPQYDEVTWLIGGVELIGFIMLLGGIGRRHQPKAYMLCYPPLFRHPDRPGLRSRSSHQLDPETVMRPSLRT